MTQNINNSFNSIHLLDDIIPLIAKSRKEKIGFQIPSRLRFSWEKEEEKDFQLALKLRLTCKKWRDIISDSMPEDISKVFKTASQEKENSILHKVDLSIPLQVHNKQAKPLDEIFASIDPLQVQTKALTWAVENNDAEYIKTLHQRGVNLNIQNNYKQTNLMLAVVKIGTESIKALIEAGADLNIQDYNGQTALILAALAGDTETVETLIKAGANLNIQDDNGETALMWAALNDHKDTVRSLIRGGADLNIQTRRTYYSALMMAAGYGLKEIVQILLQEKANPNLQTDDGKTALMIAQEQGYTEIADMIAAATH